MKRKEKEKKRKLSEKATTKPQVPNYTVKHFNG
jgi:hypothetical protein